jgi:Peptidase C39 family
VKPILESEAGDDATASLATILLHHGRRIALDEIRRAIYTDGSDVPTALQLVEAAESFGLHARGVKVENPAWLQRLPMPSIAHMLTARGAFPRNLADEPKTRLRIRPDGMDPGVDGRFAVITAASARRVEWIDARNGPTEQDVSEFVSFASGLFLVFQKGRALPPARLVG